LPTTLKRHRIAKPLDGSYNLQQLLNMDFSMVRFQPKFDEETQIDELWRRLATEFQDKVKMINVDCSKADYCKQNKINTFPQVGMYHDGKRIEQYKGNMTYEDVSEYLYKYAPRGAIFKKEEPEQVYYGSVYKSATKDISAEFDEFIAGKNVFVKFIVPWCQPCMGMIPEYEKLEKMYQNGNV
jgi:thiol-disulfide isomerase/thioredoxin